MAYLNAITVINEQYYLPLIGQKGKISFLIEEWRQFLFDHKESRIKNLSFACEILNPRKCDLAVDDMMSL